MTMIDYEKLLSEEEKYILSLRGLFEEHAYKPYKMSKFETYAMYANHRDFLPSEQIISFTDGDGRFMALKPDVTLSMIKNLQTSEDRTEKLYYNESVYRIPKAARTFKEITQIGAECIGQVSTSEILENLFLASQALRYVSEDFSMEISNMDIITDVLKAFEYEPGEVLAILKLIEQKNAHELEKYLRQGKLASDEWERILQLALVSAPLEDAVATLEKLLDKEQQSKLDLLKVLVEDAKDKQLIDKIRFDSSVMNNTKYYNGVVFRGFIPGISNAVLTGGEYKQLLTRMRKAGNAIGFAVYLDSVL